MPREVVLISALTVVACGGIVGTDAGEDAATDAIAPDGASDVATVDGGNDGATADADAAIGPSDGGIASLPGLVLWLDAEKGITKDAQDHVSLWADQSGHANDAAQTNATQQPTFGASVIHGLPAIHFTQGTTEGTPLVIQDSSSMQWGTGDFLIEVVARFDNDPAG